jgi:YfiH family protein
VAELTLQTPDGMVADACMTAQTGVACTIMVADCLPVLFTDADGRFVAAAHAGWRGLAHGVLKNTLNEVKKQFEGHFMPLAGVKVAYDASKIIAWLGPCIGPTAFEVGDEVRAAFVDQSALATPLFQPHGAGKWLAHLPGLARLQLQALGVANIYGNDGSLAWCTATQSAQFFSHRRDAAVLGSSGRMAACVWRL